MREKYINPIFWQVKSKGISPPEYIEFEGQLIDIVTEHDENHQEFSIIVSDQLKVFDRAGALPSRIFFSEQKITPIDLVKLVNMNNINGVIDASDSIFYISDLLKSNLRKQSHHLEKSSVLKLMHKKNRELELLTDNLEKIVDESSLYIELSHKEEELKLKKERQLILFIKDLSYQLSIQDVLTYLRKVLKQFHFVSSPMLCIQADQSIQIFQYVNSTYKKITKFVNKEFHVSEKNLANILGRPFLPLHLVHFQIQTKTENHIFATLCFEFQQNDVNKDLFFDFMNERIDAIKASLDRVMLENEKELYIQRWMKTFNELQYPISIVDSDENVIRANRKMREISANQSYQKMKFPMKMKGDKELYLQIYIDRTIEQNLYTRILQNEKLNAIGLLAGNLAHELNNPLTGIRSLLQIMLTEVEKDSLIYKDLFEIERATDRSQKIISNLLDFARGSNKVEQVNVDELIQKTLPFLKSALRQHRLILSLAAKKSQVLIQPHLFQQVIFNLVNNACQAMNQPGAVGVQTIVRGDKVIIEVVDSGPGVPDEKKEMIFEAFFTTKLETEGTGLGLYLVKSIIEKHQGQIQVKDQHPSGARFIIELPKVKKND